MNKLIDYKNIDSMRSIISRAVIFSLFLIFLFTCPAWAATYYVKNGGNDSLNGLSDSTAWATTTKVMSTVTSGDTVYFRSQDTWQVSGSPNVLYATVDSVTYDGKTYGSGTRAKFQSTADAPGYPKAVIHINASNVTVSGFDVDANDYWSFGIYIGTGAGKDIANNTVDDCVVHNIGDSVRPEDFIWGYSIHVGNNTANKKVSNTIIQNTEVHTTYKNEGIAVYAYWGVYNSQIDGVLIRNCYVHDVGTSGIEIANNTKNVTVEYNSIVNSGTSGIAIRVSPSGEGPGNVISPPNGTIVRYNLIRNSKWYGVIITNPRSFVTDGSFYGNIFYENGYTDNTPYSNGIDFSIESSTNYTWSGSSFNIYNNTFYSTKNPNTNARAVVAIGYFSGDLTGLTVNFKNNIVYSGNYWALISNKGATLNHSNNLIYRSSGAADAHVISNGKTYDRAGVLTWETSAKNTDPLFVSSTDFHPTKTSPAINNGTFVGLTKDYYGITFQGNPDIGAVEYVESGGVVTPPVVTPPAVTPPAAPKNLRVIE